MTLENIIQNLQQEPTLYDYKCLTDPWTVQEINVLMMGEFTARIPDIVQQLQRTEYAVIMKYLEIVNMMEDKIRFDARVVQELEDRWDYNPETDMQQNIYTINANVGDIIQVNMRVIDEDFINTPPNNTELAFFSTMGATNNLHGSMNPQMDYIKFATITAEAVKAGHSQIGVMYGTSEFGDWQWLEGLKKTLFINVT